jgi:glycosyltransferase involved in cell wall biosynthesis
MAMNDKTLNIALWNSTGLPPFFTSGVGKMFINVVLQFQSLQSVRPQLLMPADDPEDSVSRPEESPLQGVSAKRLPFSQRTLESMWRFVGYPSVDRWAGDAEWLYCPRELWCPPGRLKYAITVHDVYNFEPATMRQGRSKWRTVAKRKLVWERAIERANIVFTVSEFSRSRISSLFACDKQKIRVVPNAVDPVFMRGCPEPDRLSAKSRIGSSYVLQVGGLTEKKGARALLDLAQELERRRSELKLVVLGPVEPQYAAEASSLRRLNVLERGVAPSQVVALTAAADACILLSEYEGFGIPLLEAMACGVPVLGADRAAMPEVIGDPLYVVDPTKPADIADRLEKLVKEGSFRREAIAKGRARVRKFCWESTADMIVRSMREQDER